MSGHVLRQVRNILLVTIPAAAVGLLCVAVADEPNRPAPPPEASGKELFHREWLPGDPRSHGGDGLGPVFNDSSCVACHNLGGPGGGGPFSKNVELLTNAMTFAAPSNASQQQRTSIENRRKAVRESLVALHPGFRDSDTVVIHRFGTDPKHDKWRERIRNVNRILPSRISTVLPARNLQVFAQPVQPQPIVSDSAPPAQQTFRNAQPRPSLAPAPTPANQPLPSPQPPRPGAAPPVQAVPAAPDPADFRVQVSDVQVQAAPFALGRFPLVERAKADIRRLKQAARHDTTSTHSRGIVVLQFSQRNTTALFGVGLIDKVPDDAIEAAAKLKYEDSPHVTGRVHRMKDGKIGRFGWKAQKANLYDFTMAACGVELGLHVPDHPQSEVPYKPNKKPDGFDLTQREAKALVSYLRRLPAPTRQKPSHAEVVKRTAEGERLFGDVGCAACHTRKLGEVDGLFSDLLLHDMGPELGGSGHYGAPQPSLPDGEDDPLAKKSVGPGATEWKTPPLWGCRDSAPYLHDGRAATLEQAIAFHGGEAADSTVRYFMLSPRKRQLVIAFLKTLVAPES